MLFLQCQGRRVAGVYGPNKTNGQWFQLAPRKSENKKGAGVKSVPKMSQKWGGDVKKKHAVVLKNDRILYKKVQFHYQICQTRPLRDPFCGALSWLLDTLASATTGSPHSCLPLFGKPEDVDTTWGHVKCLFACNQKYGWMKNILWLAVMKSNGCNDPPFSRGWSIRHRRPLLGLLGPARKYKGFLHFHLFSMFNCQILFKIVFLENINLSLERKDLIFLGKNVRHF